MKTLNLDELQKFEGGKRRLTRKRIGDSKEPKSCELYLMEFAGSMAAFNFFGMLTALISWQDCVLND